MGLYLNVYLGPYVECTYREEAREVEVTGCTNGKCPEHAKASAWSKPSGKFCSACASAIGKFKRTEHRHRSTYDVLGEREELTPITFDDEKTVCLGPNIKGPRNFHPEADGDIVDLTTVDREAEIRWFRERFAGDIEKLSAAYDNLQFRWGLHLYKR